MRCLLGLFFGWHKPASYAAILCSAPAGRYSHVPLPFPSLCSHTTLLKVRSPCNFATFVLYNIPSDVSAVKPRLCNFCWSSLANLHQSSNSNTLGTNGKLLSKLLADSEGKAGVWTHSR
eukprot:1161585-Pelagomonas_calceolata.AAC.23